MSEILVVIPARLDSKRLPRKLLLEIHGRPVLYWTIKRVLDAGFLDYVVATDSDEISAFCDSYSFPCIKTSDQCINGTERVFEAAQAYADQYRYFLNVQGDEPLLSKEIIRNVAEQAGSHDDAFVTAISPLDEKAPNNPSEVKVAIGQDGRILYASRALIPHSRDGDSVARWKIHGVYLYTFEVLAKFIESNIGVLEGVEMVEQLRCIENDIQLIGVKTICSPPSVDTRDDYDFYKTMNPQDFAKGSTSL